MQIWSCVKNYEMFVDIIIHLFGRLLSSSTCYRCSMYSYCSCYYYYCCLLILRAYDGIENISSVPLLSCYYNLKSWFIMALAGEHSWKFEIRAVLVFSPCILHPITNFAFFRSISQSNQCSCWYHWVFDENAKSATTYGLSSTHHSPAFWCCFCHRVQHPKFIMFGICGPLSHQKIFSLLSRWCVLEIGVGTFVAAVVNMPPLYS